MKRLIAVLSGLLVLPAFAEVAPIYYDEAIEYAELEDADAVETEMSEDDVVIQPAPKQVSPAATSPRSTTGRTASRAVASSGAKSVAPTRTVTSRSTSSRNASTARTTTSTASRAATARATVSRASVNTGTNTATVTPRRNTAGGTTTARAATNSSIVQTDTVNVPLYTGRVGVRTSGVSSRVPTIRMSNAGTAIETTTTTTATTTNDMDELAQITDFCKAQYTQCMDNFCNVLDDNQGRCSCSTNLKNYAATEQALAKATEELQDVAQKIQYIGLTGDEIETLFTQTEAELKMQNTTDNTQLKNDLDKIKGLIVDVKSGNATATDTGISLDLSGLLDFTISSTGFDLTSMFGGTSSTSSISNQRGEQLYKTATARCKASVLNTCKAQGVDISLITNAYDLEIDKQCIQYERSLTETNSQMASTVRNAKSVLQKARLMVAQQKNAYDLRGCVNALDTCMQDDFVCGSDYENCLDPTGKWIVNGEVVVGSQPGVSGGNYTGNVATDTTLYSVWNYTVENSKKNVWKEGSISEYVGTLDNTQPTGNGTDMMLYLRKKIGYIKDGKTYGMCASVLNKCQDLTFSGKNNNKSFVYNNEVIKQYLTRTMIQIKAKQDEVLAEYADDCISDVASCLSQNNYNYNGLSSTTNGSQTYSDAAINACMSVIKTCKSATEPDNNADTVKEWLNKALNTSYDLRSSLHFDKGSLEGTILDKTVDGTTSAFLADNAFNADVFDSDSKYVALNDKLIINKDAQIVNIPVNVGTTLDVNNLNKLGYIQKCTPTICTISKPTITTP